MKETWVRSLGWEDPREYEMATHSSILVPGESHGQRSLWGYSPWGLTELDVTEHNNNIIGGLPRWLNGKESACQCRR